MCVVGAMAQVLGVVLDEVALDEVAFCWSTIPRARAITLESLATAQQASFSTDSPIIVY